MKIVYSRLIPFKGFKCVNLFGVLFVRKDRTISARDMNHESIHTAQMKELGYLAFYLFYVTEWLWFLVCLCNPMKAYYRISFEREAYAHEGDAGYLDKRKMYNQYRKEN